MKMRTDEEEEEQEEVGVVWEHQRWATGDVTECHSSQTPPHQHDTAVTALFQ